MSFARTVLGDVDPADLGVVYAHEHLVINGARPVQLFADFQLADADKAVAELAPAQALGLRTVVDAMPADCGRDVLLLAEIARRSGVHVIAPTGLHHERYYHDRHWSVRLSVEEIAGLFTADIEEGIDELDYDGPIVKRTPHRAGVMKIAGSTGGPSARDERVFAAAAIAQHRTGCPILTHCEGGTGALEQVEVLVTHGGDPAHVVLSHVDKVVDRAYQRDIAATGARVEYDQGFRWGDKPNGTLQLLEWAAEDGLLGHITLGLDAARQGYWTQFGGSPGWAWLLDGFATAMRERGLGDAEQHLLFVDAPERVHLRQRTRLNRAASRTSNAGARMASTGSGAEESDGMTPRERILAAIDHRESDRIPIDLGSSIVTSIAKAAYVPLREHLGLPPEEVVVYDEVQQLPYVGEDVLARFGVDTRMVQLPPAHVSGVEIVDDGEYWAMWDRWGSKMRMPKDKPLYYDWVEFPIKDLTLEALDAYRGRNPTRRRSWPGFAGAPRSCAPRPTSRWWARASSAAASSSSPAGPWAWRPS